MLGQRRRWWNNITSTLVRICWIADPGCYLALTGLYTLTESCLLWRWLWNSSHKIFGEHLRSVALEKQCVNTIYQLSVVESIIQWRVWWLAPTVPSWIQSRWQRFSPAHHWPCFGIGGPVKPSRRWVSVILELADCDLRFSTTFFFTTLTT